MPYQLAASLLSDKTLMRQYQLCLLDWQFGNNLMRHAQFNPALIQKNHLQMRNIVGALRDEIIRRKLVSRSCSR